MTRSTSFQHVIAMFAALLALSAGPVMTGCRQEDLPPRRDFCAGVECPDGQACDPLTGICAEPWPPDDDGNGVSSTVSIYYLRYDSDVVINGERGDLFVHWGGDPVYPLRVVYRLLPGGCPAGFSCATPSMSYSEAEATEAGLSVPLVFPDVVYCYGTLPESVSFVEFGYQVVLVDNDGNESHPVDASFTCRAQ